MLEITDLSAAYGQMTAIRNISLRVESGGILAVIGSNGAGKSTLLKTIAGQLKATTGSIRFDGEDITTLTPHERARRGVSLVPEGRRLFASLTVHENLQIALSARRTGRWTIDAVYDLFPLVAERRNRRAGEMSGGEQQATAIARALVANPSLLLLDEVSLGLAPAIVGQLYDRIPLIQEQGTAILLVEQDVSQALRVCDDVHCLLQGATSLAGRNLELADISRAYFGSEG
ncbi:amino acid/amide ABC transporter ATP-binding protein 2 (HAAT family) [Homoserinimonas aerilata]|uniref:Amino acid/amide ABC transporter ATP-binding protein 2 (HAAT family) n=1 Tax=Homoserinimonas aerilata TaxID=1162970 RepID=A0A542YAG2_9MICO|nr:ABC transporter ATP-binding protein [Homoserinimonas aerilata]TQL44954.1 amino acid/amide ABC transporter ATP-binding protein 2 (HAAT family) [Homoserinimonas aerilata]